MAKYKAEVKAARIVGFREGLSLMVSAVAAVAAALNRIADALDRGCPPPPPEE
jgi:hypothetical protein